MLVEAEGAGAEGDGGWGEVKETGKVNKLK